MLCVSAIYTLAVRAPPARFRVIRKERWCNEIHTILSRKKNGIFAKRGVNTGQGRFDRRACRRLKVKNTGRGGVAEKKKRNGTATRDEEDGI